VADNWMHQDEVRAALGAIEAELSLALEVPDRFTLDRPVRLRLLRLRLLLADVLSTDLPLSDALADLRGQLREPLVGPPM
jgi:hypothetical protein